VEAVDPADTPTSKELFLLYVWLPLIFGIPYVILGLVGGFGTTFRSGDASTFICGALVGAVGENIIGRAESRSSRFRKPKSSTRTDSSTGELITPQAITVLISALGLLAWNMYFAFQAKTVDYPPIDWVQIVAFAVAATQLTSLRFFLGDYYHDVVLPGLKVMIAEDDIPIPLLWPLLWITREHKASSKANVNDQPESDGRSRLPP